MFHHLTNHLWQSTLFALAAGLLTVAFRQNRAQVRYWLWFSASLKFLVPFWLLVSLGSHLDRGPVVHKIAMQHQAPAVSLQVSEPFLDDAPPVPSPKAQTIDWRGLAVVALWIGGFAAIAVILACVGLYGVLATAVRQRTAEIGVRMALGAAPAGIFRLVVGHGLKLSILGVAIGLAAAAGLTRIMSAMLVGVTGTDPLTFLAMTALFLTVAALASWIPAARAAGLDPMAALRQE